MFNHLNIWLLVSCCVSFAAASAAVCYDLLGPELTCTSELHIGLTLQSPKFNEIEEFTCEAVTERELADVQDRIHASQKPVFGISEKHPQGKNLSFRVPYLEHASLLGRRRTAPLYPKLLVVARYRDGNRVAGVVDAPDSIDDCSVIVTLP